MFAGRGMGDMFGEQVGVGGDHAEEIIESVRDGPVPGAGSGLG